MVGSRVVLGLMVGVLLVGCANSGRREPKLVIETADQSPWPEKGWWGRWTFMKQVAHPTMKRVFLAYDEDKYRHMKCATCHGPVSRFAGYTTMPSKSLPKLSHDLSREEREQPEVTEWMKKVVVPEMARLLGEQPYNPATHEGFGCFRCHQKDPDWVPESKEERASDGAGADSRGLDADPVRAAAASLGSGVRH